MSAARRRQAPATRGGGGPSGETAIEQLEAQVAKALSSQGPELVRGLREKGWWASDAPVLPKSSRRMMRKEVEDMWHADRFKKSQSVLGTTYYDKKNVYATEIDGSKYDLAPLMVHYTVAATKGIVDLVSREFPQACISSNMIGNKLNFCVGNGASFDPHLDLGVAEKPLNRKLTLLLYLNDGWRPEFGGKITLLGEGGTEEEAAADPNAAAAGLPASLAPAGGRWVAFWSDRMLHRVEPSFAPDGLGSYRCSYTIWFCSEEVPASPAPASVAAQGTEGFETAPDFAIPLG